MNKKDPTGPKMTAQQIAAPRISKKSNGLARHLAAYTPDPDLKLDESTQLDGIRQKVFLDRYALKDREGNLLESHPEQMWRRVAWGIAQSEEPAKQAEWEKKFYEVMRDFKFVPAGRILSGAGTGFEVTYFNCFVIPSPRDSRQGILDSLKQLVEIQARAGGVGLNLSSLRPRGARVRKVNGTSSGPVTWAGLFSYATHDVVQQGGSRRGATMLMIHDWHPDVEEFITVKQDLSKINGANLSVCVSDAFMEAVKKDGDWDLIYPDIDDPEYDEKWDGEMDTWKAMGKKVKVYKTVKAKELWDLICEAAWRSAEPGLHFLDRSNKRSNTWYFEKLAATNPCGEQPLGPWAVCNLGAINLSAYVKDEQFDFVQFGKDTKVAMRMLDNVIDQTYYFFPENEQCAKDIRRTGLGIMGLADALIKMKVKYGSEESLPIIEKIFETLRNNAYIASTEIAAEKGAFPKFDKEKYLQGYHIKALPEDIRKRIADDGIRNAVLLTIAPTGTTSLLAGVSSGVEPVYEFEFIRRDRIGEHIVYHPLYEDFKKSNPEAPKPDYFVSANDLTPLEHVKVQAVAQDYIDASISKTVNAPNSHTVEDVQTLYMSAYEMGLKGITYMRDGSRAGVLERIEPKKEEKKEEVAVPTPYHRPHVLSGRTYEALTPLGKAFITINRDETGQPLEVFATIGKAGMQTGADSEAIGRLISIALKSATDKRETAQKIVTHLRGIGGSSHIGFGKERVMSLPDAIAKVLAEDLAQTDSEKAETLPLQINSEEVSDSGDDIVKHTNGVATNGHANGIQMAMLEIPAPSQSTNKTADICPECGNATFIFEEGCQKCYSCGYSKC